MPATPSNVVTVPGTPSSSEVFICDRCDHEAACEDDARDHWGTEHAAAATVALRLEDEHALWFDTSEDALAWIWAHRDRADFATSEARPWWEGPGWYVPCIRPQSFHGEYDNYLALRSVAALTDMLDALRRGFVDRIATLTALPKERP